MFDAQDEKIGGQRITGIRISDNYDFAGYHWVRVDALRLKTNGELYTYQLRPDVPQYTLTERTSYRVIPMTVGGQAVIGIQPNYSNNLRWSFVREAGLPFAQPLQIPWRPGPAPPEIHPNVPPVNRR